MVCITLLAKGYDFEIGEEGARLSAGQRQRIAIARAVLKDAPIFLWDEATACLDAISESRIQQIIETLVHKTVIMITHRLSVAQNADCIYVVHEGRIVEFGSHDKLLDSGGLYSELFRNALKSSC